MPDSFYSWFFGCPAQYPPYTECNSWVNFDAKLMELLIVPDFLLNRRVRSLKADHDVDRKKDMGDSFHRC